MRDRGRDHGQAKLSHYASSSSGIQHNLSTRGNKTSFFGPQATFWTIHLPNPTEKTNLCVFCFFHFFLAVSFRTPSWITWGREGQGGDEHLSFFSSSFSNSHRAFGKQEHTQGKGTRGAKNRRHTTQPPDWNQGGGGRQQCSLPSPRDFSFV